MGNHDLTPPAGIRLKSGVLEFCKQLFDEFDDPSCIEQFVERFTEDALWIHENNSEHKGIKAIRLMKQALRPAGWSCRSKLKNIYPLNQASNGYLYLVTGVVEWVSPKGEQKSHEFMISLKFVDVPGKGLKVQVFNTAGASSTEDWFQAAARGLGMFRHS